MKHILKITLLLVLPVSVLTSSCKNDLIGNKQQNLDFEKNYSTFEIPISGTLKTISDISKGAYTSPTTPYGQVAKLDFRVNTNNTIDILWISDEQRNISRVSLNDEVLIEEINIPAIANMGGRFLGFDKLGEDEFILGYSKNNSFGNEDSEAWYTAFNKSEEKYSTRIFGNTEAGTVGAKLKPAQAGSAIIRYNAAENVVALYLAHKQLWESGAHQAGWLGFLNATTGALIMSGDKHVGSSWFYSHNFNQRGLISALGKFYTLAHGDAYPRALGVHKWSHHEGKEAALAYYEIENGTPGDNKTLTTTGDFVELNNGTVAITYSTSDNRDMRDLRIAFINGMTTASLETPPTLSKQVWLTNSKTENVGWGTRVAKYNDDILVAWNSFDNTDAKGSHFVLLNSSGEIISEIEFVEDACLHPAQSIYTTADSKYLIWVSASDQSTLKVHKLKIK